MRGREEGYLKEFGGKEDEEGYLKEALRGREGGRKGIQEREGGGVFKRGGREGGRGVLTLTSEREGYFHRL